MQRFSPRVRFLVGLCARLVLFGYIFQIGAFDHYFEPNRGPSPAEAALHASHCHGNVAGCAGESSFAGSIVEATLTPAPPDSRPVSSLPDKTTPASITILPTAKPPRVDV